MLLPAVQYGDWRDVKKRMRKIVTRIKRGEGIVDVMTEGGMLEVEKNPGMAIVGGLVHTGWTNSHCFVPHRVQSPLSGFLPRTRSHRRCSPERFGHPGSRVLSVRRVCRRCARVRRADHRRGRRRGRRSRGLQFITDQGTPYLDALKLLGYLQLHFGGAATRSSFIQPCADPDRQLLLLVAHFSFNN